MGKELEVRIVRRKSYDLLLTLFYAGHAIGTPGGHLGITLS